MTGRGWNPTGYVAEVPGEVDKIPPFDERSGDHLWLMMVGYRVDPRQWSNTHTPMLDQENLVALMGPGCYYCEQPWSTLLATRRCKGRP